MAVDTDFPSDSRCGAAPCDAATSEATELLTGQRLAVAGRLRGGARRDVSRLVKRYGGALVDLDAAPTIVLVADDEDFSARTACAHESPAGAAATVIRESEFWRQVGLVEDADVRQLYTPAMLAELVGAPVAAIRHWHRTGALESVRCVHRLPYFDFQEAALARRLAELLAAGCTLRVIDRRLADLARQAPDLQRPLADPTVVISGRQLVRRWGDDLAEPTGQLLLDFDAEASDDDAGSGEPSVLAMYAAKTIACDADRAAWTSHELREAALAAEDDGDLARAAECYRACLMADGPQALVQFSLADVLYRLGDLSAARERYYGALECDEEYVEARVCLGSVLAETGELELAAATFAGALRYHSDYADAHFHLANALERLKRCDEAAEHFRAFLVLAPESPWAEAARTRLQGGGDGNSLPS